MTDQHNDGWPGDRSAARPLSGCPRCSAPVSAGELFCKNCNLYLRDRSLTVEQVTFTRRILGSWILEGLLMALTLGVGWLIWLLIVAPRARTPAKALTGIYIINVETGRAVNAGTVWLRDVVLKIVVANLVAIGQVVDLVWAFFDPDRQTLHDKVVKTVVVYAPNGLPDAMQFQPGAPALYQAPPLWPSSPRQGVNDIGEELRELKRLYDDNLISREEYERKRAELASRL